jgi:hypothetical protein
MRFRKYVGRLRQWVPRFLGFAVAIATGVAGNAVYQVLRARLGFDSVTLPMAVVRHPASVGPTIQTSRILLGLSGKPAVSATENNAWQVALANRKDCNAIRRYILDYPDGHFVASAQAILAARRPITEVRWAPFGFPSNVVSSSSLEARTSRDAACKSAHVQLLQNMTAGCSDFTRDSKYRSVIVDPPSNTSCECEDSAIHIGNATPGVDSVWRCSIRSTYRCRGEQIERETAFACD